MSFYRRLVGHTIGSKSVNLNLKAAQICCYVGRGARDKVGLTAGLRLNRVEEVVGEGKGPSRRGSSDGGTKAVGTEASSSSSSLPKAKRKFKEVR